MGELFPPPGIRPQVGERLQLRLLTSGTHYVSKLVGYIKGHSIIVTTPTEQGQLMEFLDGEAVEVRMLTGSEITLFRSAILRSCISPTHYLHLEYPAKVSRQKLRQSPWVRVDIGASVVGAAGAQAAGQITNLSGNGAKVVTATSVGAERDTLRLAFPIHIDDIRADLTLDAVIRRASSSTGPKGKKIMEYGVEFSHIPPEKVLWLRCLVFERIAKGHLA
jgi:c-di-GMP-binding flagellar brake protein YcgR